MVALIGMINAHLTALLRITLYFFTKLAYTFST